MKIAGLHVRASALILSLVLLASCKIMEDDVDAGFSGVNGTANKSAPSIWGEPDTSVLVGANYFFAPEASDHDGDILEFAIVNKPAWAIFDSATGLLQGMPRQDHVGPYHNIVISVTDQNSVVSLPSFDIEVEAVGVPGGGTDGGGTDGGGTDGGGTDGGGTGGGGTDGGGTVSAPPTISGTPNTSVVAGTSYSFRPNVSDPEDDPLSFSIVNKPAWASFSTTTGRLHGTPTTVHIGTSQPIEISVTDGTSIAALKRFTITVEAVGTVSYTVSWNPPTLNVDGTPLTDLAGYRIYYGTSSGDYSEVIELNSPGVTSYRIDDLTPGTYYLAMSSVNSGALESEQTPEISFTPGS